MYTIGQGSDLYAQITTLIGRLTRFALGAAAPVLLALFFSSCIAIANFPEPPTEPATESPPLNQRFIGCFCAHASESRSDKICIEEIREANLVTGEGTGLLPDLSSTTEWVLDGEGVGERILHATATTSNETLHEVFEVELSEDTNSVALRERDGTWQYPTLLNRCDN